MSSDETTSALSRAFELVEAGRYDEARSLLDPILVADKNNADAWWIYAHAVTSPEEGTTALENVLRINPRYPGAQELLRQASQLFSDKPQIKRVTGSVPAAAPPVSFPEEFPETDAERTERTTQEQRAALAAAAPRRSSLVPLIAVAVVIVVVAVVAVLLLSQGGGTPAATPTEALIAPTLMQVTEAGEGALTAEPTLEEAATSATTEAAPTEAVETEAPTTAATTEPPATAQAQPTEVVTTEVVPTEVIPTEAAPTTAPTTAQGATAQVASDSYTVIERALASYPIAESGIGQVNTTFGNTLMVTVCTAAGREMRTLLPQVMNALAKESTILGSDVAAVGVRMLNCEANTPLLTIATDLASAQSYAGGALTDGAFAATWKPQENS